MRREGYARPLKMIRLLEPPHDNGEHAPNVCSLARSCGLICA